MQIGEKEWAKLPPHLKALFAKLPNPGSDEVLAVFPNAPGQQARVTGNEPTANGFSGAVSFSGMRARIGGADPRGDAGSAARFFKSCPYSEDEWNAFINVSGAGSAIDLQSELAASALCSAVEQTTAGLAAIWQSYRAPSTSVSAVELRTLCDSVIGLTLNIAQRFSRGLQPQRLTLKSDLVECAATPKQTDITTITASLSKFGGSAVAVTFDITLPSAGLGGSDCEPKRFHYTSKADAADRLGSKHPTVKPVDLIRYLARLVGSPGCHILDPFAGSGTTGMAAMAEGFNCTMIERDPQSAEDCRRRIAHVSGADAPLFAAAPG